MRLAPGCVCLVFLIGAAPAPSQEKKLNLREVDKQLFDVLKEVHNRGADIFNAGDHAGCYRLFQGSLQTTRALLGHRPEEQKFIDDSVAAAEKEPTIERRAFSLHESMEKLRMRLRATPIVKKGNDLEYLTIPPREWKQEQKDPLKKSEEKEPPKKFLPPKDGVMGRLYWEGKPLVGADVLFVSRGALDLRVFEGITDSEGRYVLHKVRPGKYTVLLTQANAKKPVLPERYATATTSPLIVEVKGGGDTLDLVLQ